MTNACSVFLRSRDAAAVFAMAALVLADSAAAQGGKMYWPSDSSGTIRRANLDSTREEDLGTTLVTRDNTLVLDPAGGKMYWPSTKSLTIHRANLDGTGEEDLGTTSVADDNTLVLDLAGGKMYWPSNSSFTIRRANLDGTGEEDLGTTTFVSYDTTLVLDPAGGKMYWPAEGSLHRANLDGTGEEDLGTTFVSDGNTLVLDPAGGKMYWPSGSSATIRRANLDGTGEEDLGTTFVPETNTLVLDPAGGKMYWPSAESLTIRRANLDGTGEEDLGTTFVSATDTLVLDPAGGKMYWPSDSSSTIHRANLDGADEEEFCTTFVSGTVTLVLDPAVPTSAGACCVDGTCLDLMNDAEAGCLAVGGVYLGDGSACAEGSCFNDDCDDAITIAEGDTDFSTVGATTDGPDLPKECDKGSGLSFENDIWFRYTPMATGTLTASTCDQAGYNTRLAAYTGACNGLEIIACNDDGEGCGGFTSILEVQVTCGVPILIRVGAFGDLSGAGTLTLTLASCVSDLNGSGAVDFGDILQILGDWGPCP